MFKILIVDDSKTSRKILRGILEESGYIIVGEASNGQEAIDTFQSLEPNLITLDITMPIKNGVEALKEIKAIAPELKIVMVSAAGQKDKIMDAIKAGASDFIQKPYEREVILSAVKKALS